MRRGKRRPSPSIDSSSRIDLHGSLQMVADVLNRSGTQGEVGRSHGLAGQLGARLAASLDLRPGRSASSLAQQERPQPAAGQPPGRLQRHERQMGDERQREQAGAAGSPRRRSRRSGPCGAGEPGCRGRRSPRRRDRSRTAGQTGSDNRPSASGRPGRCPRNTIRRSGSKPPTRRSAAGR